MSSETKTRQLRPRNGLSKSSPKKDSPRVTRPKKKRSPTGGATRILKQFKVDESGSDQVIALDGKSPKSTSTFFLPMMTYRRSVARGKAEGQ